MAAPKPIRRTTLRTTFVVLFFPLFAAMLVSGTLGIIVLMDVDETGPLAHHPVIRPLVDKSMSFLNGVMVPFCFNVGLVGIIGSLIYLLGPKHEDDDDGPVPNAVETKKKK